MPLADTSRAIGEVVELLTTQLADRTELNVTVGHPEPPANAGGLTNPRLNVFLYEAAFDGALRNVSAYDGQTPQLWLVLRFLITAFDDAGHSDTIAAHRNLGLGLRSLQEMSYLGIEGVGGSTVAALEGNPERIKITFLDAPSDLLGKLMQGSDERYRFSMAFELRPVMIAAQEPAEYALLVGVDYSAAPPAVVAEEGIVLDVLASMGLRLTSVEPPAATAGETILVRGENLTTTDVAARIGTVELTALSAAPEGELRVTLASSAVNGDTISAGQHPLCLVQTLPGGRSRTSNLLIFELLPVLSNVNPGALTVTNPSDPEPLLAGSFDIHGQFLGSDNDDVFVALYTHGRTVQLFDEVADAGGTPPPAAQTHRVVTIPPTKAVPPGTYRVIVRVNNAQARQSPELTLIPP